MPRMVQRHLDGQVGHGAPARPVAQRRLQPARGSPAAGEGLGILDRLAEHGPGQAAVPAADAPGAAEREGQDGETEEGDGQHHAGDHGDADEGQAEPGQAARHEEEGQLGPGPPGEGLAPDARASALGRGALLADGERQLLAPGSHVHARVVGLLRPSCVPPGEQRGAHGQGDGAVEDHEQKPDCGRDGRPDCRHHGRDRVGRR